MFVVQKNSAAIERHGPDDTGDLLKQRIAREIEHDGVVDGQQRSRALRWNVIKRWLSAAI